MAIVLAYIRFRTYTLKRQKIHLEKQVHERTEQINQQKEALSFQAIQLRNTNEELEANQKLIAGQNEKLESQNKEILNQRDEVINLNKKLNLVSQLKLSFFTNISHEFRTPLTLIIGPLERLLKEYHLNSEVNSTLQVMQRNAHRLLYLINQIMDFRKIEKGRMELHAQKVDISRFIKGLYSAFQPLAEIKEIRFDYSEKNVPEAIWVDVQKLENIIYNLLSNAFKYTPKGGLVELKIEGMEIEGSRLPKSTAVEYPTSSVISFKICDSGIGISEENLPLIFKRFYRIESEEAFKISGSGVGLAITEELVKTHHGEIYVDSHPGKGSVFEVQVPELSSSHELKSENQPDIQPTDILQQIEVLKNEFMTPESHQLEEEPVIDKEKATVLVVEDSHDLRNFITHRLRKRYNVIEAENGVVALQLAHQQSPDIVISDVMMPKMDGLELCANLKGNLVTSHIPLVLLTSKSAVEDQLEGLQIGADDYLPKPFNFDLLEVKIQNFIETHQKLRKMFIQASDLNVGEVTTNSKDQKFLEKAVEIVSQYMHDSSFGVKEFVDEMGISRSLLHKKLTGLTDQSAAEFINHLKMKKARRLLQENSMNISEVAYAVGYNDPKYFSRIFSKHFNQSPKAFVDSLNA